MTTATLTKTQESQVQKTHQAETVYFKPATDVWENAEAVVLQFDMPGVNKDNVDLIVEKGTLTVTGKASGEEAGKPVYRESRIGDFRRTFSLSDDVDTSRISAEMKAGVLTVRIPKPEQVKPRRIEIASS